MIKVSVIIPIYNMGKYLEECLNSVFSQSLKEIEVICINDGSTDNTIEILKRYSSIYSNIVIVNQENLGVGKSRNNGINIAKGEFVAFIDPDDFYPENNILECLYNNAKSYNVNICGGSLCSFKNGVVIRDYYGSLKDYTFFEDKKMKYEEYQYHFGFSRFIYNLDFLKKNNIFFPLYSRYEDPPFLVKAMVYANEFYSMKKVTYCYRQGYKKVILTPEKTIDYAKGILDLLKLSSELGYSKLHNLVLENLHNDLSTGIYKHAGKYYEELENLIYEINKSIDVKLLKDKNKIFENPYILNINEINEYIKNNKKNEVDFIHNLSKYNYVIIYGAGKVALFVYDYIKYIDKTKIICFAVTDTSKNPKYIDNIPVRNITQITEYKNKALVLIATYNSLHQEIKNKLEELEFKNILPIYFKDFHLFSYDN